MLLDILFPKRCLECGLIGVYICSKCQKSYEYIKQDYCIVCERPADLGKTHPACSKFSPIDHYLGILKYRGVTRKIVKNIKYRGASDIFHEFFLSLNVGVMQKYSSFRQIFRDGCIQPIPLHENREKARGFNQAEIIAGFFSAITGYPVIDILLRKNETSPQAFLSTRKERKRNMTDAFGIRKNMIVPENIILIDDVVTSSHTVSEAASLLRMSGGKKIAVFSIAHG